MEGKNQISFAASAMMDLEDMQAYYSSEGAFDVGKRLVADIISQVERLQGHPLSGRVAPEVHVEHLREIIYPPFRIVYQYDKNTVRIIRIWRSEKMLRIP